MKLKALKIFTICFLLICSITTTVQASVSPVKDVFFINGNNCFLVLMENGNLYMGDSIDTQTPQLINTDIKDVVVMTDVLDRAKRIQLLHSNGDVEFGKIHYDTNLSDGIQNSYEGEKTMFLHASEIFETDESYRCLYIVDPGNLEMLNTYTNENTFIMSNIETCPVTSTYALMAISKNDVLYSLEYNSKTKEYDAREIMTNVKDANKSLVLRNNGDLYLYRNIGSYLLNTPERIGTNVGLPTDVEPFDNIDIIPVSNNIRYLNNQNEIYQYSYGSSVKKSSYATNVHYPENYNFWRFMGNTEEFYLDYNGNLCINNKDSSHKVYLHNVRKVIAEGTTAFFITNNGELYAEDKESVLHDFDAPFLTVFGQKSTKIYMNNKEVILTAKLQTLNDRTMYPFRECLEELGATVLWDDINKIAIGEYGNITIEFPIGTNKYYINGVQYEMDTISYIDNSIGRTYIPIRFAAEALGFTVDWIQGDMEDTISIYQ